jgi:hypothetical protein
MPSSGLKSAAFPLVAYRLNHLCYRVAHIFCKLARIEVLTPTATNIIFRNFDLPSASEMLVTTYQAIQFYIPEENE